MDVISQPIAVAADFGIQISSRPKSINMTTYGYFYRQPLWESAISLLKLFLVINGQRPGFYFFERWYN